MKTDSRIPQHIGIIMDGNRRWAKKRGLKILLGHRRAADQVIEPIIEHAGNLGIKYLTFWCFSTENWRRDSKEVAGLFEIFRHVIKNKLPRMMQKGARIKVIGDISNFPKDIIDGMENAVKETENNTKITVNYALGYGGRDEILRAINKIVTGKQGTSNKSKIITEDDVERSLDTMGQPDPDLIIRTGGEQRLSGFLTWQAVYAELYFTEILFPDFRVADFDKAIEEYAKRQRRFGR